MMRPQDLLRLYEEKISQRCFSEIEPLISRDAVFWFPDGAYCGIDEIRTAFERTWEKLRNEHYWFEDVCWITADDVAAGCMYRYFWEADIDGRRFEGRGRGTAILRKERDGWKIAHEHLSRIAR